MSIWITGDTHIPYDFQKLSIDQFPEQRNMNPQNDFMIICGDFGGIWDGSRQEREYLLDLNSRNFTTLWIDGNHENFNLLESKYEKYSYFMGGKVQRILSHIYHLKRGQIFTIQGKTIFTMGGATSVDKFIRIEGKSWWPQEIPNKDEWDEAINNLNQYNNKVDLVITHCAPSSSLKNFLNYYETDEVTDNLNGLKKIINFKDWYFGHYHMDRDFDNFHAIYKKIIKYY